MIIKRLPTILSEHESLLPARLIGVLACLQGHFTYLIDQMPIYRCQLAKRGLTQSMSRKGNCLDNAAMESFFGTRKSEFFHLNRFDSIEQL